MRNNRLFLTLFLFGFIPSIFAENFVWPTDASHLVAATFCEYRPGHFHAGIDIKTWGQEGYKAFAIDDGSVVRVQVSPFGYGRAVYFQTVGELTAVYAHLSRFNDLIEAAVRLEQIRQGRFAVTVEFAPGEMPLSKGALLAYTGSTGTNAPHLHFEIRDVLNRPVNPYFYNFRVSDHIPPRIRAVALAPLNASSHAAGDFKPRIYHARPVRPGKYRIDEVLTGWGDLGLSVYVSDLSDGAANPLAAYSLGLWIDSTRVFYSQFDRFSYALTRQVSIQRDGRLLADQKGEFQRLYRANGNLLGFYEPDLSRLGVLVAGTWNNPPYLKNGQRHLQPGNHTFRIVVDDYWGNASEVTGVLHVAPLLLSQAESHVPNYSHPAPLMETDSLSAQIQMQFYDDYLRFEVRGQSLSDQSRIDVFSKTGKRTPVLLTRIAANAYAGAYALVSGDESLTVEAVSSSDGLIAAPLHFPVFYASGVRQDGWVSEDHRFRVRFPAGAVFSPIWGSVSADSLSLPTESLAYRVIPDETPLNNPVLVQFAGVDATEKQLGIYRIPSDGHPIFVGREIEDGFLSASTRQLGRFAVMQDSVPPEILSLRPFDGTVYKLRRPHISCVFRDQLSGIGDEDDYVFTLDGDRLIVEYDPKMGGAFYPNTSELKPGDHFLTVEVRDRAGNVSRRETRFKILPN